MNLKNRFFQAVSKDAKQGEKITPQAAFEEVQAKSAVLLDVREENELVKEGIAETALWLPTSEIAAQSDRFKQFVAELPQSKKIIVYCAAGVRAGRFAGWLEGQGFRVANMGGFQSWAAAGLPVRQWEPGESKA
jgi:rhodanese-related sulfurtransferase